MSTSQRTPASHPDSATACSATPRTLSIIGAGQLGCALGTLFHRHRLFRIQDVMSRRIARADEAVQYIGAGHALARLDDLRAQPPVQACLLAVPDNQIEAVAAALASLDFFHPGQLVFHCSGSLASTVLHPAARSGALTASVHPIRSFANRDQVVAGFAGTFCGVEGMPAALSELQVAFSALGAQLVPIDARNKVVYHAAAVFASNYLVTLMDAALVAWEAAGIAPDTARQMLAPLAGNTLANIVAQGPRASLSGPIARGDMATVQSQSTALHATSPELGQLYDALADSTVKMRDRWTSGAQRSDPDTP